MRTLCDVCQSAGAILFCAADEAALCRACDEKVHSCNKLANRHIRVGLADPRDVPCCDICENAPAFFYCEVDGTSLCLQCDMVVHVGGKRTHARYLLLRQRIEFPRDKPSGVEETELQTLDQNEVKREHNQLPDIKSRDSQQNHPLSPVKEETDAQADGKMGNKLIDLNSRPRRIRGQTSINQEMDAVNGSSHESVSVVPVASFKIEPQK